MRDQSNDGDQKGRKPWHWRWTQSVVPWRVRVHMAVGGAATIGLWSLVKLYLWADAWDLPLCVATPCVLLAFLPESD